MKNDSEMYFDFICRMCEGKLVVIKEVNGRKIYNCENRNCPKRELVECTVCHKPRSIFVDDGNICSLCALAYLEGRLSLTPDQIAGIEKYGVTLVKKPK